MVDLGGRDVLRADQFTTDEIDHILNTAERFADHLRNKDRLNTMAGRVLATLFYEPSTRTRLSFESAMARLGGEVVSVASAMTTSSAAKGETLHDTGKMIESYADVVVIRHPLEGSAEELAGGASIPVINGGDGTGQHPTQALLDLYTIRQERGTLSGLTVALIGDLKNGRTVHSLAPVLALLGNNLTLVSPRSLAMPDKVSDALRAHPVNVVETENLAEAAADSDVLYVTRMQKERFEDPADYEAVKGTYVVDLALIEKAKPGVIVMHPLPRVDEIAKEVDTYEGAAYFRQAGNGVPVRMALISLVAGVV
jgi:aspartate carbamoyltransferase catalytic subunit